MIITLCFLGRMGYALSAVHNPPALDLCTLTTAMPPAVCAACSAHPVIRDWELLRMMLLCGPRLPAIYEAESNCTHHFLSTRALCPRSECVAPTLPVTRAMTAALSACSKQPAQSSCSVWVTTIPLLTVVAMFPSNHPARCLSN